MNDVGSNLNVWLSGPDLGLSNESMSETAQRALLFYPVVKDHNLSGLFDLIPSFAFMQIAGAVENQSRVRARQRAGGSIGHAAG